MICSWRVSFFEGKKRTRSFAEEKVLFVFMKFEVEGRKVLPLEKGKKKIVIKNQFKEIFCFSLIINDEIVFLFSLERRLYEMKYKCQNVLCRFCGCWCVQNKVKQSSQIYLPVFHCLFNAWTWTFCSLPKKERSKQKKFRILIRFFQSKIDVFENISTRNPLSPLLSVKLCSDVTWRWRRIKKGNEWWLDQIDINPASKKLRTKA